jgi:hypothetical protein
VCAATCVQVGRWRQRRACCRCLRPSRPPKWSGAGATPAGVALTHDSPPCCHKSSAERRPAVLLGVPKGHQGRLFDFVRGCARFFKEFPFYSRLSENMQGSCRHSSWGGAQAWEARGSRFRQAHDYAADLRHAQRWAASQPPGHACTLRGGLNRPVGQVLMIGISRRSHGMLLEQ